MTQVDRFESAGRSRHSFPWHPMLEGAWKPWPMEGDIDDVAVIQGTLPEDLTGTYFKTSPNLRYTPVGGLYHAWLADAMVHAVTIVGGRVSYRNRWVRTPKFVAESEAGRAIFEYVLPENPVLFTGLEPYLSTPETEGIDMASPMTSVLYLQGQLLAFGEGDTTPIALDPWTLDTLGPAPFARNLPSSFNPKRAGCGHAMGHIRFCPVTAELFLFTIALEPPYFTLHIVSPSGELRSVPLYDAPFASYIHDFMISGDHVIVVFSPVVMSYERVREGGGFFSWEQDEGTHVAVISRREGNAVTWIGVEENVYATHPINAYEADGKIIYDFPEFPAPPIATENSFDKLLGILQGDISTPLVRWEIDVANRKVTRNQLDDRSVELPRVNDRVQGQPYRYAYLASREVGSASNFDYNMVIKQDMVGGECQSFSAPEAASLSEAVFCPREGGVAEDDGYLLTIAYRPDGDRSDLYLIDAQDVEAGPVATLAFPHRIPMPSHGTWTAATPT